MTYIILIGAGVCAMAAAAAAPAQAQVAYDRDRNMSVRDRANEAHKPLGIRTGAFLLLPRLDLGVEYNDNIYAAPTNETEDTIFTVAPSIVAESQWSVHRLSLFGGLTSRTFADAGDDDVLDYRIGADGQIDVRRDTYLTGNISTGEETEQRFTGNGPAALKEPIEIEFTRAGAAVVRNVNRIRASLGVDYANYDYKDGQIVGGGVFDEDFRDYDGFDITGRLDYAISPDTALFGAVTHRDRNYDQTALNRDSQGWRYLVGANFDLSATIRGEVGVGYSSTDYDNPAFENIDGVSAQGQLEWFPTQITTVTLNTLRDTVESDIGGASGIERTSGGIRVDHELRRDIILNGGYNYGQDKYEVIDRDDDNSQFFVGADWHVNRLVTAGVGYDRLSQNSDGVNRDRDFDVNRFMFTVSLRR
jgi:hypothetical protein